MARWALKDKHYLNVPGTIWEQKETSQQTGKQIRRDYPVGLYLDPNDPADCNYKDPLRIIVSNKRSNEWPADIVFTGPPTYDMEPLDDEARDISSKLGGKGDPFADLPTTLDMTLSDRVVALLEKQIREAGGTAPVATPPQDDRIASLEAQIEELKKLLAPQGATNAPANGLRVRRS